MSPDTAHGIDLAVYRLKGAVEALCDDKIAYVWTAEQRLERIKQYVETCNAEIQVLKGCDP